MTEIRPADRSARRHAAWLIVIGALVGALLILAFQHYQPVLQDWLVSNPRTLARRARLVLLVTGCVVSAPLVVLALYLWRLGGTAIRCREFPAPGQRVIRDTVVLTGHSAERRGRRLRATALLLVAFAVFVPIVFWRLGSLLSERAVAPVG